MQKAISSHHHVFLAADHERSERKTWAVIILCGLMMAGYLPLRKRSAKWLEG